MFFPHTYTACSEMLTSENDVAATDNDSEPDQHLSKQQEQYRAMSPSTKAAYLAKSAEYQREQYRGMSSSQKAAYVSRVAERKRERQDATSSGQEGANKTKKSRPFHERCPILSPVRDEYFGRGRERYRAMSPGTKAKYIARANERSHKRLVLKKFHSSQVYQDAEPTQRQQMEDAHVEKAMEQFRAKRAEKAIANESQPQEMALEGTMHISHRAGRILSPLQAAIDKARNNASQQKRRMLKDLRESQAYQNADSAWRQHMEGFMEDLSMDRRKAMEIEAMVKRPAEVDVQETSEPQSRGEKVAASLISGFGERMIKKISQQEHESKEQEREGEKRVGKGRGKRQEGGKAPANKTCTLQAQDLS